ncbi:MAG: tetratricopeptide repeat protein [Anaerolineae bacterium]
MVESGHADVVGRDGAIVQVLHRGGWVWGPHLRGAAFLRSRSRLKLWLLPVHAVSELDARRPAPLLLRLAGQILLPALLAALVARGLGRVYFAGYAPDSRWVFDPALFPALAGNRQLAHQNVPAAEAYFQWSLALNANYAPARYGLGASLYRQGATAQAAGQWRQAVAADPQSAAAYTGLALALAEQGNLSAGTEALQQAIHRDPNNPALYRALGQLQFRRGNMVEARRAYLEASRLEPNNIETVYMLGYLYLLGREYSRAAAYFEQALALKPDFSPAEQGLGAAYFEQRRLDPALNHFLRAAQLTPGDPTPHFYAGVIYEIQHRPGPALESFQRVVQLTPSPGVLARAQGHIARLLQLPEAEAPMSQ